MGSKKKNTISISPVAIIDPICWSPPSGPLNNLTTGWSKDSSINLPVVPVATRLCFDKTILLCKAHYIKSFFLLSCAINAIFFLLSSFLIFVIGDIIYEFYKTTLLAITGINNKINKIITGVILNRFNNNKINKRKRG